jgi:radical SAM protein with 4Fe4S-binding SPASM domain
MIVTESFVSSMEIQNLRALNKIKEKRGLLSFDIEVTARCNFDCRHCYINLSASDRDAQKRELSLEEIELIADQAVSLGALWCLITGGEPLLRQDFSEIYFMLKQKGLLVSLFTNASLINKEHVKLFYNYPPRDIEVTVYGATQETYERVTCRPGSFAAFRRGLDFLQNGGVRVRLKAMALRSNVHELPRIARFCRERTKDYFRFDPLLHLRFNGDPIRNERIRAERLLPGEIVAIEQADNERAGSLRRNCNELIQTGQDHVSCNHLFHCGAGEGSFNVSYNGLFRLCSSLWDPDCVYDLRKGSLADAWNNFVPRVRDKRSNRKEFLKSCRSCNIINLCMWCPAHAHLECGEMDGHVDYFCQVAHARAEAIKNSVNKPPIYHPIVPQV